MRKVDEREATAQHQVTPVDTKCVDTDRAFQEEPMQIRSRLVAREFESVERPDLYAGTPPLEALKSIVSIAANRKETTERRTEFENKLTGVYPVKANIISHGSLESVKALNRRLHWGK